LKDRGKDAKGRKRRDGEKDTGGRGRDKEILE
jgi:hypothetical protein